MHRLHVLQQADHHPAEDQGEGGPADETHLKDRDRAVQPLAREVVGDQGIGARSVDRPAGADADAAERQLPEGLGEAAEHGHQAPDGDGDREDDGALPGVDQPRHRHADQGVEHRDGRAEEQAEADVGELQVVLDRLLEKRDRPAVQLQEHQGHGEDAHRIPAGRGLGPWGPGRRWWRVARLAHRDFDAHLRVSPSRPRDLGGRFHFDHRLFAWAAASSALICWIMRPYGLIERAMIAVEIGRATAAEITRT